ncbi:MAG: prepilin-type N-terminal cleavage/methylation domain-containing protein [Phycisphaera sp.]|nr:MAG: prepilin-type N-terminal cleavage/methylation domain-containing protein [Phycisphaera sp.]
MSHEQRNSRHAFTLIELLVVIGIIAILAGIGLSVGLAVVQSSRASATKNTIQTLETYLSDLNASVDHQRSYKAFETVVGATSYKLPVLDGRENGDGADKDADKAFPSGARFIAAGDTFLGDSAERWGGFDSDQVREFTLIDTGSETVRGFELTDQWGNPIRAVHPAYDGGHGNYMSSMGSLGSRDPLRGVEVEDDTGLNDIDFRRSFRPFTATQRKDNPNWIGDADEGDCSNDTMYFYSAGPDGDPGTRDDNVYGSAAVQYPVETRDLE